MPHDQHAVMQKALESVPAKWRAEFRRFVLCGESSDEFMAFLEQNEDCLAGCDTILNADDEMALIMSVAEEDIDRPIVVKHNL